MKFIFIVQEKSDLFSFGMCLLEIILRTPLDDCYDWTNFRINEFAIFDRINKLKGNYSNDLIIFI